MSENSKISGPSSLHSEVGKFPHITTSAPVYLQQSEGFRLVTNRASMCGLKMDPWAPPAGHTHDRTSAQGWREEAAKKELLLQVYNWGEHRGAQVCCCRSRLLGASMMHSHLSLFLHFLHMRASEDASRPTDSFSIRSDPFFHGQIIH